jgi:hypothetical protein
LEDNRRKVGWVPAARVGAGSSRPLGTPRIRTGRPDSPTGHSDDRAANWRSRSVDS